MTTYREKLLDPRWQKKRLEVFDKAKFACENCGADDKTLHVHHVYYDRDCEPWEYEDSALIALCKDCHDVEHLALKESKEAFIKILADIGARTSSDIDMIMDFLWNVHEGCVNPRSRRRVEAFVIGLWKSKDIKTAIKNMATTD